MKTFRDLEGNFYQIPSEDLTKYKVQGELPQGTTLAGAEASPAHNYPAAAYNYRPGPQYNYAGPLAAAYNYPEPAYNYEGPQALAASELTAARRPGPQYNYAGPQAAAYNYEPPQTAAYNWDDRARLSAAAYNYPGRPGPQYNYAGPRISAYNYQIPAHNYPAAVPQGTAETKKD